MDLYRKIRVHSVRKRGGERSALFASPPALALLMNLEAECWPAFGGPDRSISLANALSSSRVQSLYHQLRRSAVRNGADFHIRHPDGDSVPHLVNSTPDLCCDIHEWPVEPLRGSTNFFAHAAFFTLRARAARNRYDRVGLFPAVSCVLHQGPVQRDDLSGVVYWDGRHRITRPASRRYSTDTADLFLRQS